MSQEEVNRIKEYFSKIDIHPIYLEHEEVITSEDAAKTRGFELKQGIKAIVLTNDLDFVVANIPAHKKVGVKKVAEKLNWSKGKIRMASEDEVLEKTGCVIGAVPPFGHKEKLPILVDEEIYENTENAFNIGQRTISVKIKTTDIKKVFDEMNVIQGDFSKD